MDIWSPAMATREYGRRPPIGSLVAVQRKPWRVLAVEDIDPRDWDDATRERWIAERMPDPWRDRPFRLDVEPAAGGPLHSTVVGPGHRASWQILPEHYAVCVTCAELAPCLHHTAMKQAEREMVRLEREMQLLPGCCPACQEPITSRQETVTFPGENLLLITGASSPTFHLRNKCRGGAERYERMWVTADPTRPRSLLTLSCAGTVIVHQDGTGECFGADGGNCPSVYARHRSMAACFVQSHGCGQGCTRAGHPGARLRRPANGIRP